MKTKRVETSLKNTQMLQAPMIPTTSADPKVAILRNHSILSDLFIVSHHDSSSVSWAAIMVKDCRELRGLKEVGSCALGARCLNVNRSRFAKARLCVILG